MLPVLTPAADGIKVCLMSQQGREESMSLSTIMSSRYERIGNNSHHHSRDMVKKTSNYNSKPNAAFIPLFG